LLRTSTTKPKKQRVAKAKITTFLIFSSLLLFSIKKAFALKERANAVPSSFACSIHALIRDASYG